MDNLLKNVVSVQRRFQRSIRIDTDLNSLEALEGFVCPESSANVLSSLSTHIIESGQSAFTWTGPYGSGKSSLVIALNALVSADKQLREIAERSVGKKCTETFRKAFPSTNKGWTVIPVVGQRSSTQETIGKALLESHAVGKMPTKGWTDSTIVDSLIKASKSANTEGVILIVDEMGKFLEAAVRSDADLYLFQQLAEAASRSDGKLVVIGILHQAFAEYANRLSRDIRDEWSKIQGRFVDLSVNTAGEEQIELLSRAIQSDYSNPTPSLAAQTIVAEIQKNKPGVNDNLIGILDKTWPLHPAVAALLGPISRRRFGQNQRSLFGFLNSAEMFGFQDFLGKGSTDDLYMPEQLWQYLRTNLEPAILASPDGHRWAMASEVVDRCEAQGASELHLQLMKTIAVLDLFRDRSGVNPTNDVLYVSLNKSSKPYKKANIDKALRDLQDWSFIIYRKYLSSFSIFAGSDFDIEKALEETIVEAESLDVSELLNIGNIQPVLAKRHYFETGTQRWAEIKLTSANNAADTIENIELTSSLIAYFILLLPLEGESNKDIKQVCRDISLKASAEFKSVLVGIPNQAWRIIELARELKGLELIRENDTEVQGDVIALREINSRLSVVQNQLETELQEALMRSNWFESGKDLGALNLRELNNKTSEIAESLYPQTPVLPNELLNRTRPSGSAIGGQNALLTMMAENIGEPRLGIEGHPTHGGLFESLLNKTGLYKESNGVYQFVEPAPEDDSNLSYAWNVAQEILINNSDRSVPLEEIYQAWEEKPIGMRRGLMPILSVAFILSMMNKLAFYREGVFQAQFREIDTDYLAKDPSSVSLRWMDIGQGSKYLLSGLAELVRKWDKNNPLTELEPLDVARGLVAIFDRLPNWAKRTQSISSAAIKVRSIFKTANDPNQLLFSDLPNAYKKDIDLENEEDAKGVVQFIEETLGELVYSYKKLLDDITSTLVSELMLPNASPQALLDLNSRAKNIQSISGDFRLDAFSNRLAVFDVSNFSIEGIASLAANKPARDWVDADRDKSLIEIAELASKFIKTETYARVRGRDAKRQSLVLVMNNHGKTQPYEAEIQVNDSDREKLDDLIEKIKDSIQSEENKDVVLAALLNIGSEMMDKMNFSVEEKN